MVNAQEWLDKNYPKEERSEVRELYVHDKKLKGDLDLSDFINLEELECYNNQLTNLNLSDLEKLKILDCSDNNLTNLRPSNCVNITYLNAYNNKLKEIDFSSLDSIKVNCIYLNFNTGLGGDLSIFSRFINLETLGLSATSFAGSLKPLQNCSKLKDLYIAWSDIDSGLEYLPEGIDRLYLDSMFSNSIIHPSPHNPHPRITRITEQLKKVGDDPRPDVLFEDWKKTNANLIASVQKEREKGHSQIQEMKETLAQRWLEKNYSDKQQVEKIEFNINLEIAGELAISDFPNLEEINNKYWSEYLRNKKTVTIQNNYLSDWIDRPDPNWKKIDKITAVIISNCPHLEKVDINNFAGNQELKIINCPNLKELDCQNNQLTKLEIINCPQLQWLWCHDSQLTSLDLSNNSNLRTLDCSYNHIKELNLQHLPNLKSLYCTGNLLNNLDLTNNLQLETLKISDNNFVEQDLSFLSNLVNLKKIKLGGGSEKRIKESIYNRFYGSLEPLKNMTNLETLNISNTDIDSGLEYLSENLKQLTYKIKEKLESKVKKIHDELFLYGKNLRAWKEAHPELMGENKVVNSYENKSLKTLTIPHYLWNSEMKHVLKEFSPEENSKLEEINYQEITLRDKRPFSWETKQNKSLLPVDLPIKLYNIKKDRVEEIKDNHDIKSYATLSYFWGKSGAVNDTNIWNTHYKDKLNLFGYKALYKAVKSCEHLGIDYLWMDQLCIDQTSIEEKNQEVPKMRKYYNNAEVALVAINTKGASEEGNEKGVELAHEILPKVVNSQWFTRSWTFQEGWLSKQMIFMFDDYLVDGRLLAQILAYLVRGSENLNEDPQVFITPLGWTYSKNKDNLKDQTSLGLSQALSVIKSRGRSVPIDGIYSILGLLPYGEQVKPEYKEWGHQYSKEELDEALMSIMKLAVQLGYPEPLSWLGSRSNEPNLWWIPQIDENGSTSIKRSIDITCEPGSNEFTENGVKLIGSQYVIGSLGEFFSPVKNDFTIQRFIKITNDKIEGSLWGTEETLEKIKAGDILVIPSKQKFEKGSKGDHTWWLKKFAILVPGKDNLDCSIDIVGINLVWEKTGKKLFKLFVNLVDKTVIELGDSLDQEDLQKEHWEIEREHEEQKKESPFLIINPGTMQVLKDNHEQLISLKKVDNRNSIRAGQKIIKTIRQSLLEKNAHINEVQGIYRMCERQVKNMLIIQKKVRQSKEAFKQWVEQTKTKFPKEVYEYLKTLPEIYKKNVQDESDITFQEELQLEEAKKVLSNYLTEEEIYFICKKQAQLSWAENFQYFLQLFWIQEEQDEHSYSLNWKDIHPNLTADLINQWQSHNFTPDQCKEWLDIGLQTYDYEYAQWLRDIIKVTPEQFLNEGDETELRELFQEYQQLQQEQLQTQIQVIPHSKNN